MKVQRGKLWKMSPRQQFEATAAAEKPKLYKRKGRPPGKSIKTLTEMITVAFSESQASDVDHIAAQRKWNRPQTIRELVMLGLAKLAEQNS